MTASDLFEWVTHTGLAVTLLIVFVLLIRRPFARVFGAGAAYSLWSLPFIRLFLPEFNLTLPTAVSEVLGPVTKTAHETYTYTVSAIPAAATPSETTATTTAQFQIPWAHAILTLWFCGAVMWLAYHLYEHIKTKKTLIDGSSNLPSALKPIVYQAKRQLGMKRDAHVRLSTRQTGPLVIGFIKPLIILPAGFMSNYSRRQQHFALSHELAHIKRGDLWVAIIALVFRALNWPNPLIHYAARKFRADQEAACDAFVLARLGGTQDIREGYAETLVHAAKHTMKLTPTPLGLTIYHPLKERLMTMKTSNRKPGLATRALASICLVGALAVAAPFNLAAAGDETATVKKHINAEAKVHNKGKQVIKWVEDKDGVKSEKHYEVISKDGVKKAYKISKGGARTEVPMSEIESMQGLAGLPPMPEIPEMPDFGEDIDVFIMEGGEDGDMKRMKKRVKVIRNGQHMDMRHGEHENVIIKKMMEGKGDGDMKVFAFSSDDDVSIDIQSDGFVYGDSGSHSKMMVDVAADMLDNVEDDDISDKAKRKVEKARKALKEAQEALADDK